MDRLAAPDLVGQRLDDRYHLLRSAGQSGAAAVFEAEDERLQRRVTVHLFDGAVASDATSHSHPTDVLDAGDHDGLRYVVLPLVEAGAVVGRGEGDEEPTQEIPTATDHTAVLPIPLVPVPEAVAPPEAEPSRAAESAYVIGAGLAWRRVVLAAVAGVVLLVLALGLAARNDGVEVPSESSVPVTADTTTTLAPTTTSPPTTQAPQGRGHGKGKKDD